MRITKFWAKGYRSLRDVELDGLGEFNVFYGPNGSGKSNVLAAIDTLLRAAEVWASMERPEAALFAQKLAIQGIVGADDQHQAGADTAWSTTIRIEAVASADPIDLLFSLGRIHYQRLSLALSLSWNDRRPFTATLESSLDGTSLDDAELAARAQSPGVSGRAWLLRVARELFWTVPADRTLHEERIALDAAPSSRDKDENPIITALRTGHLQTAVFHAKNDWDRANRARFDALQRLVSETLHLPPLDVGRDPTSGLIDLRQPLPPGVEQSDISMRHAGLGVVQVVAITASLLFARCRVAAIEEPEAHLHAPSTGRALRKLLTRLVSPPPGEPRVLDQLFIATHSNLFDLDPSGYWDVSMVDGETHITRKPLDEIDAHHLYEPGPAKHALMQLLRYAPEDEVVFRTGDGQQLKASEMLQALQDDTDVAVAFLESMHAAAMQVTGLRARRMAAQRSEAAK